MPPIIPPAVELDIDAGRLVAADLADIRRLLAVRVLAKLVGVTYTNEVLADNPSGYWRLGEASGTTAFDASGNSNHGTYTNAPTLGADGLILGDDDTAVTFDAVDDQININGLLGTLGSNRESMTAEFWVKTTTTTGGGFPISLTAFSVSFNFDEASVLTLGKTQWSIGGDTGSAASFSMSANIYDGATHHVVIQITGTSPPSSAAWVDGVSVTVTQDAGNPASLTAASDFTETTNLFLGTAVDSTLDEIALYPTRLSPARILAHYEAGTTRPTPTVDDLVTDAAEITALQTKITDAKSLIDSLAQIPPP